MAITKQKKLEIVAGLNEKLRRAATVVFVNFHGLNVAEATALRRNLRAQNVDLTVAKKTLIRRALGTQAATGDLPDLPGEIALAASEDEMAPARGVYEFERERKETARIVGGIFEGRYLDAKAMTELAMIPSREILLGRLLWMLNSPLQRLAIVLGQIAKLEPKT